MAVASSSSSQRALLRVSSAILVILVVAALHLARVVLIPLALAILLTFILAPVVGRLQRGGLGRVPSVVLVAILVFLLLGGIGVAVTLQMKSLAEDLPRYQKNITQKIAEFQNVGKGTVMDKIHEAIAAITETWSKPRQAAGTASKEEPMTVRVEGATFAFEAMAVPLLELLATVGLITILVIFMLVKREDLRDRVIRLLGCGRLTHTTKALDDADQRISRFLVMQLTINAGFGSLLGVGIFLVGVPYAFLWGFLTGLLRFVPYIGSSLAAILLLTFSLAAFPGWTELLVVLVLFVTLELVTANVIEPLLFGHSTGVSPFALLVATAFWAWLWGPVGLLLSTPLTVCLVVLGKYVPALEFFDVLLGVQPALEADVSYYQRLMARDQDEAAQIVLTHAGNSSPERVYDDLLVPALNYAKRDRGHDTLTELDERFILQTTREIMEDLSERQAVEASNEPSPGEAEATLLPKVRLLGCPARDETDQVGLEMLRQLLDPKKWQMDIATAELLTSELLSLVEENEPALICIGALPPGGLSHTRYLCKRLRSRFPEIKIVVGRWGFKGNLEENDEQLRSAGADHIETTLLKTQNYLTALLPVLAQGHPQSSAAGKDSELQVAKV